MQTQEDFPFQSSAAVFVTWLWFLTLPQPTQLTLGRCLQNHWFFNTSWAPAWIPPSSENCSKWTLTPGGGAWPCSSVSGRSNTNRNHFFFSQGDSRSCSPGYVAWSNPGAWSLPIMLQNLCLSEKLTKWLFLSYLSPQFARIDSVWELFLILTKRHYGKSWKKKTPLSAATVTILTHIYYPTNITNSTWLASSTKYMELC